MLRLNNILPILTCCLSLNMAVHGQEKPELSLNLGYFNDNGRLQYLVASTKTRVNGKFQAKDSVPIRFYISDESPGNLLGKAISDRRGNAVLFLPPSAKEQWDKSPKQTFLAVVDSADSYSSATANADVSKAKIELDTAADRAIVATVLEQTPAGWRPVKEVDLILAVKRLGSNLNLTKEPTHTTDSAGKVSVDFKLQNLPGDDSGNLVLVAKLDASDVYGTITSEKRVPWGAPRVSVSGFDKRTLYARRGRSPIWLGFIAYSISLVVWGVIVYLLLQIRKIRRIGLQFRTLPK